MATDEGPYLSVAETSSYFSRYKSSSKEGLLLEVTNSFNSFLDSSYLLIFI